MNLDRNFRVDRPFNMLNKVVINDLPDKISKKYILHLFKLFLDYDIYYLAQTELSLINKNLQGFFETDEIDSTLKNILLNKTMFFEHISQWKRFCQNLSFSIGTRFHGNMFAMQVGVPSVWLSHDSRTIELLEFVKLPYIIVMKK
ncbi:TPA: polysaccharide pyruvyl transferase family protein, partial [Campylobacter coli]|nr:polysaccharide pyruvyl transferase family protein [Campylobacter coli]